MLGFEVTLLQDLNKAAFKKELSDIAEGINRSVFQYDRLFVAILGHGNQVRFVFMQGTHSDWETWKMGSKNCVVIVKVHHYIGFRTESPPAAVRQPMKVSFRAGALCHCKK